MIADFHAGFEEWLRYERGMELSDRAPERRRRLRNLLTETDADRFVVLGDLVHSIGGPGNTERDEIEALCAAIDVPITLVKGNHDGVIEDVIAADPATFGSITVTAPDGVLEAGLGMVHGHSWPRRELLDAEVLCIGHEHPCVRLTDEVGGSRVERVWLRGPMELDAFRERFPERPEVGPELIVFPAFNELCGGTWVNVPDHGFLSPYLPAALPTGDAYLLDGTHLGPYQQI